MIATDRQRTSCRSIRSAPIAEKTEITNAVMKKAIPGARNFLTIGMTEYHSR